MRVCSYVCACVCGSSLVTLDRAKRLANEGRQPLRVQISYNVFYEEKVRLCLLSLR